ncbi:MAG: arginase family protein [Planctomycetes bacterium]|nr:arginase family protein [Planctomycetota bacterium]
MKTAALFFPFDLFGSGGAKAGAELLADAFQEMLADNKRERQPTRARAYTGKVRFEEFTFDTLADYQDWRKRGRHAIREVLKRGDFLIWTTGNHLGVLPLYDELAAASKDTLVVQFDAHLDIYNLSDCTSELSHGNFLLHCAGPLPPILNLGHRELLLRSDYIEKHFLKTYSAAELAVDPQSALDEVRRLSGEASRIFLDLDCDVFDPAFFPGAGHAQPFGLSPHVVLQFIDALWSEKVAGLAISEFDPARDQCDRSLATLVWLMEYILLKRFEK